MISITDFYNGRDVFITGATGFLGKVLIEKLIRSCSNVGRVFVLLRKKRSKSIHERLEEIKKLALFEPIMKTNPEAFEKIVPIEGDVSIVGLGLSDESRERMKGVSVVFHSAASVRFDDELYSAIILNTRGTHEVIKYAVTLSNLVSFVHVSTTYCYPDHRYLDEKIYPAAGDWREALKLVEKIDRNMLECLSPHYTNFKPNSYVYTKALAEQICESYKNQIPITIVRPSIVTGTEHEPVEGWNDNFNGPVGLLAACGLGIMRTMYASRYAELNCVAVDIVAKTLIVAAWKNAMENQLETPVTMQADASNESRQLHVYNCASLHNMDLDLLVYDGQYLIRNRPFEKAIWIPGGGVTLCKFMNFYRIVCFQLLPALLIDQLLKAKGNKPLLMKLQRKIAHASIALKTFVHSEWNFGTKNFDSLNSALHPDDDNDFNMNRKVLSDHEYYMLQIIGARKYLMKEPDSSLKRCKRRLFYFFLADRLVRIILFGYIAYLIAKRFNLFGKDDIDEELLLRLTNNDTIIGKF